MRLTSAVSLALALVLAGCPGPSPDNSKDGGTTTVTPDDGGSPDAGPADGGDADAGNGGSCNVGGAGDRAVGFACNSDADCASGHCYLADDGFGDLSPGYCSVTCDASASTCPDGFECDAVTVGEQDLSLCVTTFAAPLPPNDGSETAGEPCSQDGDCADGMLCETVDEGDTVVTFCAPACDPTATPDSCGACGTCTQLGYDDNFDPAYACAPKGPKALGEACATDLDCASFDCEDFCTQPCGGDNDLQCPSGATCEAVDAYDSLCVPDANLGSKAEGDACSYSFECPAGDTCADPDFSGNSTCRPPAAAGESCEEDSDCATGLTCQTDEETFDSTCEPPGELGADCGADTDCVTGLSCREVAHGTSVCSRDCTPDCGTDGACASVDIDTEVAVYGSADDSADALASNDDADYPLDLWSEIDDLTLAPGSYWIQVKTFSFENGWGTYRLSITFGSATPAETVELPETPIRNDSPANAQVLAQVPAIVSGTLEAADDVDWYEITIPDGPAATVRVRLDPGAPSACLPAAKVGQSALGDTCDIDAYCASGDCEAALGVCGQPCATDADCGDGNSCITVGTSKTCASNADIGQGQSGDSCEYDYECASGLCATFRGTQSCAPSCDDPAAVCPLSTECATVEADRDGQSVAVKGCVPEGDHSAAFNAACALQSDCQSGLSCEDGFCRTACASDADCPHQDFPPAAGCQPCASDTDCGADEECVGGAGYESFCAPSCDPTTGCANPGFSCVDVSGYGFDDRCVPDDHSCRRPVCVVPQGSSTGSCAVPTGDFAERCDVDADCTTGLCDGGFCTRSCSSQADCACDTGELACDGASGECLPDPSALVEVEPDDTADAALELPGVPVRVLGTLTEQDEGQDVDDYAIALSAGDAIQIVTRPMCGVGARSMQTVLTVYEGTSEIASGDETSNYDALSFTAPDDATYVIEVASPAYTSEPTGAYVLEVTK